MPNWVLVMLLPPLGLALFLLVLMLLDVTGYAPAERLSGRLVSFLLDGGFWGWVSERYNRARAYHRARRYFTMREIREVLGEVGAVDVYRFVIQCEREWFAGRDFRGLVRQVRLNPIRRLNPMLAIAWFVSPIGGHPLPWGFRALIERRRRDEKTKHFFTELIGGEGEWES